MKPGYSHIIQAHHLIAVGFGCQCCFLCHRNVRSSGGCHHDLSQSVCCRKLANGTNLRVFAVIHLRVSFLNHICLLRRQAGNQNGLYLMFQHRSDDPRHLLRCLSGTVDHLSCALANSPVQVYLCVTNILKRFFFDGKQRVIYRKFAAFYCLKSLSDLAVHPRTSRSRSTAG